MRASASERSARSARSLRPSRRALLTGGGAGLAALGVSALGTGQAAAAAPAQAGGTPPGEGPWLPVPEVTEIARLGEHGCEGLVFDAEGRMFMSNTQGSEIFEIAQDGTWREWTSGELVSPNGHRVLPDGTHVVVQMGPPAAVVWLDPNGTVLHTLTEDHQGRPLRCLNDLAIDPRTGGVYFTDPGSFTEREPGRVFYVEGPGERPRVLVDEGVIDFPNGVALSPDNDVLYISEGRRNRVLRYPLTAPGQVGRGTVFTRLPSQPNTWSPIAEAQPDGLAVDSEGRLYIAHFGTGLVRVRDRYGRDLGSLDSRTPCLTNFAFGGPDLGQLFITAHLGYDLDDPGAAVVVRMTLPGIQGLPLLS